MVLRATRVFISSDPVIPLCGVFLRKQDFFSLSFSHLVLLYEAIRSVHNRGKLEQTQRPEVEKGLGLRYVII